MSFISVFDVLGPNMIGPSSSHTAGAARIAYLAQKMIAGPIIKAEFILYGSFARTYRGHGTDRVLLGGIIGALVAIGNFAGICFVVQKVIDEPDEKKRKAQLQISYNTRMLLQALWIIIAIAAPCFQAFAGVLPLLFPRVTIYYLQITGKYKPLTPPQEPVDIAVEDDPAPAEASAVQPRDEGGEQE